MTDFSKPITKLHVAWISAGASCHAPPDGDPDP